MSYKDCLACKEAGTKPTPGKGVCIVYDPTIQMPGTPTIQGHRLSAQQIASRVLKFGIEDEMDDYQLTREEALVACWWGGLHGPRRLRQALRAWAENAGWHLWYQCASIPDPPREEGK